MKQKKMAVILLAAFLVLSFCMTGIDGGVRAENRNNMQYYGNQLSGEAKGIYNAMYEMYRQGIFKTGTESYDLVENGHITQEQLSAMEGKYDGLLQAFGAARDAFYADYPDIFYVDFSRLSITVEGGSSGEYKAYLGTREEKETYFLEGFDSQQQVESAISEHEARVNEIVREAAGASGSVREQVIYAHNALIENTSYRLEDNCSPGNRGHVRTSYGALIKHESLCEGYARGVKTVLDSMGISSVIVQGMLRDEDGSEALHMWNYVQIDGKWYGIDATANDGTNSDAYLLADGTVMGKAHTPDGVMSEAGFRFTYPQLEGGSFQTEGDASGEDGADSQGYKVLFEQDGLRVEYRDGTEFEEETGVFKVSYKGMGYQQAVKKEGVYILSRFYQFMPETGKDEPGEWGYSDPTPFMIAQSDEALIIPNSNSRIIEFAVTKTAPEGPLYGNDVSMEELQYNWRFHGAESEFLAATGQLKNPKGNYVPSPSVRKLTPGSGGYLTSGKKYSVTAVFSEQLEEYDGQTAGYEITATDGWSAVENSKIENFKWDGDRTITFDFTASEMIADSYARYNIQITGLRGKGSQKIPEAFSYDAKKKISICTYRPQGYYWNVFGKPELLEPKDLSYNGWKLDSGENIKDVVTNLVLVASKPELKVSVPDKNQTGDMINKIEETLDGKKVMASATYNIDLLLCNKNIVKTGDSIRLSVGFPEGYGPGTEDVVYKAYHFLKGADGQITGVEEIGCAVTQYGLVIACKSFSPFAVAAVEADKESADIRRVLFLNSAGGEIEGEKIRELKKTESQTVTVKAKEGYCLSSIHVSGKELPITDKKSMSIEIAYDKLAYDENIVDVNFTTDNTKPEATEKPQATVKPDSAEKPQATVKPDTVEKPQATAKPDTEEKPQATARPEAAEKPGTTARPDMAKPSETAKTPEKEEKQKHKESSSHSSSGESQERQESVQEPVSQAVAPEPAQNPAEEKPTTVPVAPVSNSNSGAGTSASSGKRTGSGTNASSKDDGLTAPAEEMAKADREEHAEAEVSQPVEEAGIREVTEVTYEHLQPKDDTAFWIILAAISGVGVVGVAIVVFVKMRR